MVCGMRSPLKTPGVLCRLAAVWLCLTPLASPSFAAEPNNDDSLRQLRLKNFVMPEFPEFLRMTGTSRGIVTAAIGRDAEGYVTDVFVLSSDNPRLTESVTAAVKQWRFAFPAQRPPPGQEIVPVVRFLFTVKGVSIMSGTAGTMTGEPGGMRLDAPLVMPGFADLDEKPKPLEQVMPRLAGSSVERLKAGSATVKFFVDETGKVRVPVILECTAPDLGQAAITAVEQWRFEPPHIGGRSTIVRETLKLDFAPVADAR